MAGVGWVTVSLRKSIVCISHHYSLIQRAAHRPAAAVEDVGVDHRGADVFVTQEFLDGADIVAILQKVSGKGVAEGMAGDALLQVGFVGRLFDSAL